MAPSPLWRHWQRLRLTAGAGLFIGGLLAMLVSSMVLTISWLNARTWATTEEAQQAARQVGASTPRWLDDPTPVVFTRAPDSTPAAVTSSARTSSAGTPASAARAGSEQPRVAASEPDIPPDRLLVPRPEPTPEALLASTPGGPPDAPAPPAPSATLEPRAPASAIELVDSQFRFLDPPEPGARALITLQVRNRAKLPTGPLRLDLSRKWLAGWRVVDAEPPVLDDRVESTGQRIFDFPSLGPVEEGTYELRLVATDDLVDPPDLRLALATGDEVARARPETVAPRPHPGPARVLQIPKLDLRAAVVPTAWEPPAWVVGQLQDTANLSEGNTVLIGHLNGLVGNVFGRLDELTPGDEIIATSRGLEYRYVVSEIMVLPGDTSLPMEPTDDARLTLMTCSGEWDPVAHDYSHRLWVVAESEELAEGTLLWGWPGPLTRQLEHIATPTLRGPLTRGPSPKEAPAPAPEPDAIAALPPPATTILSPSDGALVGQRVTVRGRRTEAADPAEPLWMVVRASIPGSRWYLYDQPLAIQPDGTWEASLEIGGAAGIEHTILVAPADPATNALLRKHAAEHPGEPLTALPEAFEGAAQVVVQRR